MRPGIRELWEERVIKEANKEEWEGWGGGAPFPSFLPWASREPRVVAEDLSNPNIYIFKKQCHLQIQAALQVYTVRFYNMSFTYG